MNFKIRCSALGKIMGAGRAIGLTEAQKKELETLLEKPKLTDKQQERKIELLEKQECKAEFSLSQTAKSYIEELVDSMVYEYELSELQTKEVQKGIFCEPDSINLYNAVFFKEWQKNTVQMHNEFIQGTCDIDTGKKIIDIKSSWDKKTFPKLPEKAYDSDYEWQVRGYMWLYNRESAEVAHCLVSTPEHLLNDYDNLTLHDCDNIPIEKRITICKYERDLEKEAQIIEKVKECRRYAEYYLNKINHK